MLDAKDPRAAAYVHEESSLISKKAKKEAEERRLNYTLDGTGTPTSPSWPGRSSAAKNTGT